MRKLFIFLCLIQFAATGWSQIKCKIGDSAVIYIPRTDTCNCYIPAKCISTLDSLHYSHPIIPFYVFFDLVWFKPQKVGFFQDTIIGEYTKNCDGGGYGCYLPCGDASPQSHFERMIIISGIGIDSSFNLVMQDQLSSHLSVYPNPASNAVNVKFDLQNFNTIHLHIFNELGKDIMTIYDGMLPEGKRDFSFKLPQGMYYVRMETAEGVVTKKVVVN